MTHQYIGTKVITAWHATNKEGVSGMAVKYEDGYISWSPDTAFKAAYRVAEGDHQYLTFGDALHFLKLGKKLARRGWNGKGMFVFLVNGSTFNVSRAPLLGIFPEGTEINYRPHIDIKNVDGSISTWVPSIGDVMAEDWSIV